MNNVSISLQESIFAIGQVACDLVHPKSIRSLCNSAELYAPGRHLDKEENHETLEAFYGPDFDGEEVCGGNLIGVSVDEFSPCCLFHAPWSGLDSMSFRIFAIPLAERA
jgi:hypothetical protein